MANKKRAIRFSALKGIKLYNAILKKLGEENRKRPKILQLGIKQRRRIVSDEIYPSLKGKKPSSILVNKLVGSVIRGLPPSEACNPIYLSPAYLEAIEYYDIDNRLRNLLPDCVDVRVNAGSIGKTKIFNTRTYSYTGDGVKRIVDKIRNALSENVSGFAYFSGIVKLKYKRPNNKQAKNYFVDFVLYINDKTEVDTTPADITLPSKEKKKKDKVRDFLSDRLDKLEKQKRKAKRLKKKSSPEEKNKKIDAAINALKALYKAKLITKPDFEKKKKELESKKK